jgi:hypothetical protein
LSGYRTKRILVWQLTKKYRNRVRAIGLTMTASVG